MSVKRILIVDDQALFRDGLEVIFGLEEDMEVIGYAEDGQQAVEQVRTLSPDIVLMDIQMPVLNGIESIKQCKAIAPDLCVIILTTFSDYDYIVEGLLNGASGFLLKDMRASDLVDSVRKAYHGQLMLPVPVAKKLAEKLNSLSAIATGELEMTNIRKQGIELSEREREIATLMLQGLTNRQIANTLMMTEGTIKNYISNMYSKVGINDRAKFILYLQQTKFLTT
ncbi:response regulator transcription factor [Brevibacillus dissolubilis]|uniref:response regulator transcription factor n=1 Tax=Brevibacillus dissolubilis TaxID=1844116 RepID=UPI00111767BA|nr:response regulator transcription factor [Brevibacillus dissolubilis]